MLAIYTGLTPELIEKIHEYHMKNCVLQLLQLNDPVYGLTSPDYVFSHDQVPIELCQKHDKTIDSKGVQEVYDATSKSSDTKRFCTLNLFVPMTLRPDMANLPNPHVVFSGKFQTGNEWHDPDERELWDDGVAVSFQENAWVDTPTHIYGLEECLGPINSLLEKEDNGMKGVTFEDNLSVHLTARSLSHWANKIPFFLPPQFLPAGVTDIIQVIDRHIGILYKQAVYLAMRKEMMRRLQAARKEAGRVDGVTVPALIPREKRILITKAIGDCHRRLAASGVYKRAFIATATWMPIQHLLPNDDSDVERPSNAPQDSEVKLQHLPEYNYAERCSREKTLAAVKKINKEKELERAESVRIEVERKVAMEEEANRVQPFVDKAESLMEELHSSLMENILPHLELIHSETGLEEFVIGGSWASAMIVKAVTEVCKDDGEVDVFELEANDVDIYHGAFTTEPGTSMVVHKDQIEYKVVEHFHWEINTVKCGLLSADNFLANNDLNITASCFHVNFASDQLFSLHALACFWEFVFQKEDSRIIKTAKMFDSGEYGARTFVRIAFKAFEMGFKHSISNINDPSRGKLAKSHKEKFDKMGTWVDSPFREYNCNSCNNQKDGGDVHSWVLKKKHDKIKCIKCTTAWSNVKCSYKMCKGCCVAHVDACAVDACKVKSHA